MFLSQKLFFVAFSCFCLKMSRTFRETPERLRRRSLHTSPYEKRAATQELMESTPVTRKQNNGFQSSTCSTILSLRQLKQSLPGKIKAGLVQEASPNGLTGDNLHLVSSKMELCETPGVGVLDSEFRSASKQVSPFTPICNAVKSLKERIEHKFGDSSVMERVSPGLARLRSTPGKYNL